MFIGLNLTWGLAMFLPITGNKNRKDGDPLVGWRQDARGLMVFLIVVVNLAFFLFFLRKAIVWNMHLPDEVIEGVELETHWEGQNGGNGRVEPH
jgi:hypothetical protein